MDSKLQTENRQLKVCLAVTLASLAITGAYAYTRYVHFGPIAVDRIPLYVSNKMISWSSVVLLCLSLGIGPLGCLVRPIARWRPYRMMFGLTGVWLATLHIVVSLPIFNMFYYTGFFNFDGTLKMTTELSMLAGALAWCGLLIPLVSSLPSVKSSLSTTNWQRLQTIGFYALFPIFGHIAWLGWDGWFLPASWFGDLPPITLLSCLVIMLLFIVKVITAIFSRNTKVG